MAFRRARVPVLSLTAAVLLAGCLLYYQPAIELRFDEPGLFAALPERAASAGLAFHEADLGPGPLASPEVWGTEGARYAEVSFRRYFPSGGSLDASASVHILFEADGAHAAHHALDASEENVSAALAAFAEILFPTASAADREAIVADVRDGKAILTNASWDHAARVAKSTNEVYRSVGNLSTSGEGWWLRVREPLRTVTAQHEELALMLRVGADDHAIVRIEGPRVSADDGRPEVDEARYRATLQSFLDRVGVKAVDGTMGSLQMETN